MTRRRSIRRKPGSASFSAPPNCSQPNNAQWKNCANARLSEYGYLDDAKFAQSYASLRLRERPIGRRRLERDLSLKKIDKQTASTALDEVFEATPEEDLIERAIAKRIRLRGKPESRADAKKLFDHLLRQGFSFELVSGRVRSLTRAEPED